MTQEPITDDTLRRLSAEGCNAAELSAYTGMTQRDISAALIRAAEAGDTPATIGQLASVRQIQAEFGVSRATAYRWKATHAALSRRAD